MLKDLPGCCVRIDDILVSGGTDEIHLENLHRVLQRLQECGIKLNPKKFHFMLDQVVYLGTTISAEGISLTKERVKAIREAEAPTNVPELQSFLGSANFICKFVPDFARIASPLYQLLCKEKRWNGENWNKKLSITSKLLCAPILFYDPTIQLPN